MPKAVAASFLFQLTESRAFMGVETFPAAEESFELKSQPGETIQVNLKDLNNQVDAISVCWFGSGSPSYSDSYYFYYYDDAGTYKVEKDMYKCKNSSTTSWCSAPGSYSTNVTNDAYVDGPYSCYQVNIDGTPIALRIFTSPGGGEYRITALDGGVTKSLPAQGYKIISVGEVTSGGGSSLESKKATRKKVTVEKTLPYPIGPWYDFAVTSVSGKVSTLP